MLLEDTAEQMDQSLNPYYSGRGFLSGFEPDEKALYGKS